MDRAIDSTLHRCTFKAVTDTIHSVVIVKLTVQSNIWISNKGMLIMVTIHSNRYRAMFCLYMMFLKKQETRCYANMDQDDKNI